MAQNKSTISRRFITLISIIFSVLIVTTAISFNFILRKNTVTLQDTIIKGNQDLAVQETQLVLSLIKINKINSLGNLRSFLVKLTVQNERFLNTIIYRKTEDENYFKVLSVIRNNNAPELLVIPNTIIKEEKKINYLRKAMFGAAIDKGIQSYQGHNWLNVYTPLFIKNKKYILHLMVSVKDPYLALDNYYNNIKHLQYIIIIISTLLIVIVIILLIVLNYNISYLIRNLTAYIQAAAQGDHDINLKTVDDHELNELAVSFNSLVEELKEKSDTISEQYKNIFKTGVAMLKENKLSHSIAIFKTLTILKEEGFGNYFNLGVAYAKNKEYTLAAEMFRNALKTNPEHEMSQKYLKKVLNFTGKDE